MGPLVNQTQCLGPKGLLVASTGRTTFLSERYPVLLRALSVSLAMTLTIEELTGLLGGEVLTTLHGLALLSLLRVATMLLSVVLLAVMLPASMLTSVSHYNITQD